MTNSHTDDQPGNTLWIDADGATFPALEGDSEVDVTVIGAGIVGLTAALRLVQAGKRVALIESRRVYAGRWLQRA